MQHHRDLHLPDGLDEVCDPEHLALIVYDMQVGIVRQLPDGQQVPNGPGAFSTRPVGPGSGSPSPGT
jgi:hypothetical protein